MNIVLYILAIIVIIWSQTKVTGAYNKYRQVRIESGITGYQVARRILDDHGLQDVQIEVARGGNLSDHYDPRTKTVRLSNDIYNNDSVASVAVAAHECGHAVQHAEKYAGIKARDAILPAAMISSQLGWVVVFIGIFTYETVFFIGIFLLVIVALFQLITLPVELNASSRALTYLTDMQVVNEYEHNDAKKMLSAAAFTYIAALLASVIQILRMVLINSARNRD